MKIWLKLFIGITLGILAGFFLPETWTKIEVLENFATITVNIGRYVVFPLVLFCLISGVNTLIQKKRVLKVFLRTLLYTLISGAILSLFGAFSVLLLSPKRIPVISQETMVTILPDIFETVKAVFPRNFFMALFSNGDMLLPIFVLAVLLGFNMNFNKMLTRPAVQIVDAFSGIFRHLNSFIIEFSGLLIIPIAWFLTEQIIATQELALFKQMLTAILIDIVFIIFIVFPIIIYFTMGKKNPYKWIVAALAPALAALASGDSLYSLSYQMKNSKENMKANTEVSSFNLPFLAIFGKAGTAMISSIAFIVILKSYSSLGITLSGVLWVSLLSFIVSFFIGTFPGSGVLVSVALLCSFYGRGIEEGYLLLSPIMPILLSLSVMLDTITNSLLNLIISYRAGLHQTTKS